MLVTRHFRTLAIAVSFALAAPGAVLTRAQTQGTVDDARLSELSGLAVSPSDPTRYWAHNDSGNPAELFALDRAGHVLAQVRITGATAFDWEDIAAFTLRGKPYLA
ncbi:integral membrane protein, partial [mine drainage metagenome]